MTEAEKSDRRPSGTNALGVGIAIGVFLVLAVGWLAFEAYRASRIAAVVMAQAPSLAAAWAEDVRAGRLDAAYAATTAGYRAHIDRQAFERWVAEHPELKLSPQPRVYSFSPSTHTISVGISGIRMTSPPPRLTYRTAYVAPGGKGPSVLTLIVTSEGGPPLVDRAEIEPEPPVTP